MPEDVVTNPPLEVEETDTAVEAPLENPPMDDSASVTDSAKAGDEAISNPPMDDESERTEGQGDAPQNPEP